MKWKLFQFEPKVVVINALKTWNWSLQRLLYYQKTKGISAHSCVHSFLLLRVLRYRKVPNYYNFFCLCRLRNNSAQCFSVKFSVYGVADFVWWGMRKQSAPNCSASPAPKIPLACPGQVPKSIQLEPMVLDWWLMLKTVSVPGVFVQW